MNCRNLLKAEVKTHCQATCCQTVKLTARISIHEFMDAGTEACVQIQRNGIAMPVDGSEVMGIPDVTSAICDTVTTGFKGIFSLWFRNDDTDTVFGILNELGFVVHVKNDIAKCRKRREQLKDYYLNKYGTLDKQEWINKNG